MSLSEAKAPGRLSSWMCLVDLLILFASPVWEDVVGKCLASACSNRFGPSASLDGGMLAGC